MKILRLLNNLKSSFLIVITILFFTQITYPNEPVDIWNPKKQDADETVINNDMNEKDIIKNKIISFESTSDENILSEDNLNLSNLKLIGVYDPQEHNLNIDMWSNSDGDQIRSILKKIQSTKLSNDAKDLLEIALLTNALAPENLTSQDEFNKFKLDFLLKKKDFDLIKKFLLVNKNVPGSQRLIESYVDHYLLNGQIENSCKFLNDNNFSMTNDYIDKFIIYCLIYKNDNESAQVIYDLKKENGFNDKFFDQIYNFLMGYSEKENTLSENTVLDFHLSRITSFNFLYSPDNNTEKFIWKYLSNYNLLEKVYDINIEDDKKILNIEKATHENNYTEIDLLNLYKRFDFSLDELLNVKKIYNSLPNHKARALFYQRLLLTYDIREKLFFAEKIKSLMIKDNIGNAYNVELSRMLKKIEFESVPSEYTTFYNKNIISENIKEKKIRINNKIIHQSKLINYFIKKYDIEKLSKNTNDILKKIKSDKNYIFSNKDKILLDSVKYEGAKIKKNYQNLYKSDPNVPTDLQVLVNNEEKGMILLRLVEIIGEDKIEDLGTEDLYFITTVLNQTDLDIIRNKILIKILPLKV